MRSSLVLIQMSLSFVLLVGAGLLVQSLQAVRNANPGFSTEGVLTTSVDLFTAGYNPQRAKTFQDELVDRLESIGGVERAAWSRMTPFTYRSYSSSPIAVDGYDAPPDQQPTADYNEIGPGFLATMGIPLVAGREFTRADNETSLPVAIVDETMAAQFWRDADPVGRRLQVKGQVVTGRRRREGGQVPESPGNAATIFLRSAAAEFLGGRGAPDSHAAERRLPSRRRWCARSMRSTRTSRRASSSPCGNRSTARRPRSGLP